MAQLKDLIVTGDTTIVGNESIGGITTSAGGFVGNLTGTASKAIGDKNGADITTTYYKANNPNGYTSNTGTITGVSVNSTSVATSGVANITSIPASILTGAIPSAVTATTQSQGNNSTKIATTAYVDTAITSLPEPMIFKGSLGTDGTITSLPTAAASNEGFTYKVITAGTYASQAAKVGDTFISDGSTWILIPSGDEPSGTVTSITLKATSPIAIDSSSAITTSGTRTLSHANSGVTAGTYRSVTVNATGHVTAGTNPTTLNGYGITDAKIASGVITLGSNTITPLTADSTLSASKVSGTVSSASKAAAANLTTTQYGIAHYTDTAGTFGNNPCLITTSTGGLEIKGMIAGDSGTSGHGLYSGGGYHNAYNNLLLHGDATTGSSGIAFISDKINASTGASTSVNQPSDRAFIQYHAYGITTAAAEGTAPTISTSGEKGRFVIGVGNDADDQIWLQAPSRTGLIHQVGANSYVIPDTGNTSGNVGSATQPVYVTGGVLTGCTYSLNKTVPSDAVFTDTDTKNTAGSTDTSSKIFLIGATSQAANPQTYSDDQVYATDGVLTAKIFSSSAGVYANTANSGTAGGISLYGANPASYGVTMRNTGTASGNLGKHGYVQGDWAGYLCFDGATNRGYIFRQANNNIASIGGTGNAVFNGSVTIGGNAANTSGARMEFNSTDKCIEFNFV